MSGAGVYTVAVTAWQGSRVVGRARVPVAVAYPPELRDPQPDPALLARVAEAGGGRVLRTPQEALAPPPHARHDRDAWPALATASLVLFLLELVARRVPAVASLVAAVAEGGRRSAPADAWYAEADRWRPLAGPPPDADTELRARLYVARLKRDGS